MWIYCIVENARWKLIYVTTHASLITEFLTSVHSTTILFTAKHDLKCLDSGNNEQNAVGLDIKNLCIDYFILLILSICEYGFLDIASCKMQIVHQVGLAPFGRRA